MIQGFYSAVVGAQQQMLRLDVQGNNIANVSNDGYRAQTAAFQSLMYGMLGGIDGAQLPKGSGAYLSATGTSPQGGSLKQTGQDLDYAILGTGYFALYDPATGETSYTRDGAFSKAAFQVEDPTAAGGVRTVYYLSDGEGRQVLGQDGLPIVVTDSDEALPVGVFSIQYEDGLVRADSERFLAGPKNGAITAVDTPIRQGCLEESNVDLATELTQVIEAQRSYSYVLKMVQTADEVESTINGLTNG